MFFPKETAAFKSALAAIHGKPIVVLSHIRPDGDCIGSTVGLVRTLAKQGFDVIGVNADSLPRNLLTFIGDTAFTAKADASLIEGRTPVTVDCADHQRIGKPFAAATPNVQLNIDHHISNTGYAAVNIIADNSCATAEILAGIFLDLGWPIDPVAAQALYVGIATDTGQFRFRSTTANTFAITHALIKAGASPGDAALELYENERFSRVRLLQKFLSSLQMELDGLVCIGSLPNGVYEETGATIDEAEGLVDYARSIEGVEIGGLIEERSGKIKASLRAKKTAYRVDQIAARFNGGGHACAAGLNVENKPLETFYAELVSAITEHVADLRKSGAI